jgi:hypothetical protein
MYPALNESNLTASQEKQFKRMRKQIEHDQKNREYTYQLFHSNCTRYAKSIAQIAGIDLPASVPLIKLFIPSPKVHKLAGKVLNAKYTPPWVRPLLLKIWTVNINIFGLFWGAGLVDKEVSLTVAMLYFDGVIG